MMNRLPKFLLVCGLLLAFAAVSLPAAAQGGAALTFTDITLQAGQSGTIDAHLTCDPQCGVVALEFTFDPAVIRVDSITPGSALGNLGAGEGAVLSRGINPSGAISYSALSIGFPTPAADNLLFQVGVTAVAPGTSTFTPAPGASFGDLNANLLSSTVTGGTITVTGDGQVAPTAAPTLAVEPTATVAATTQTGGECLIVAANQPANIHVGPDRGRTIRGALGLNVQVLVTGQFTDEDGMVWWRIQPENFLATEADRYWVAEPDVTEIGDCVSVPQTEGSQVISGGGGGGTGTFSHRFTSGERTFTHSVPLGANGRYTMTCNGTPFYPFFVFNNVPSNGQTSVTINAGGTVNLTVSQTLVNQGQTVGVDSYNCTLTRG